MSGGNAFITITLNGQSVVCNADGTALFDHGRVLAVSDLHLEKGRALSKTAPMPRYDTDATLIALEKAITRDTPEEVVFLGDSFHRAHLAESLADQHMEKLHELAQGRNFTWITGNHDPELPASLPGVSCDDHVIGMIAMRHIAEDDIMGGEVSGHYHPKVRIKTRARAITGKCFIHDGQRMIMPSFGAFTGGLSIFNPAIKKHFTKKAEILFCHACQIYRYPYSQAIAPNY